MTCTFISELSRLRKSSAESVENTVKFDEYKEYLHVERSVEKELRQLLSKVNETNKKTLVLLCGSAGDGKSHLISYLKNYDGERLLNDYETYNDATESSEPTLTSIDTLALKLSEFNDTNYNNGHEKKMIMAINLGTLSNFIESEKGEEYTKLKEFVTNNNILSGYRHDTGYFENSVFQFVSFSDYQIFELNCNGVDTSFLENLVGKIFEEDNSNPFYLAHKQCDNCALKHRCPVNHNYGFMSKPANQRNVVSRIVEVIIKDKAIVSTRDVLNLFFDLLVHPDFSEKGVGLSVNDTEFISNYICWTTPMILNGFSDISPLLDQIIKHDTLKKRTSESDENAMNFHSMEDIGEVLGNAINGTPYEIIKSITNISTLGGKKPGLKKDVYCFLARLGEFKKASTVSAFSERINQYINYLYLQNSNNEQKLNKLYSATKKAIYGWNWSDRFQDDYICIDDSNDYYWVIEKLELEPVITKSSDQNPSSIKRFSTVLNLGFKKAQSESDDMVNISIDYALYELIMDMQNGYKPTIQDKNRHTEFVSSIQRLIEFGEKKKRIVLIPKGNEDFKRIAFEKSVFSNEFKVM